MNIQSTQSSGCLCVCVAGMALSLATLLHFSSVTSSSTLWDSWAGGEKGWLREGNRGAAPHHPRFASRSSLTWRTVIWARSGSLRYVRGEKHNSRERGADYRPINKDPEYIAVNSTPQYYHIVYLYTMYYCTLSRRTISFGTNERLQGVQRWAVH